MGKKKGAIAAKARAKREERNRSTSPLGFDPDEISLEVVPADGRRVHRGLANLGNTCYMNSVLQCLNVSTPFSDELLESSSQGFDGVLGSLCSALRGIRGFGKAEDTRGGNVAFTPKVLREEFIERYPWYAGKDQHDAHEFLRTLLGCVSDETTLTERALAQEQAAAGEKISPSALSTVCGGLVSSNFRGQLCAATLCWGCRGVSFRLDPFLDVMLELPSLAGQGVGSLGIRSWAAPEAEPPPGIDSASRTAKNARAPAPTVVPKEPTAVRAPKGVWGAKQDAIIAEELRATVRVLVNRMIVRVLERELPVEIDVAEVEDAPSIEIELTRKSRTASPRWGFIWSEVKLGEGSFVVCKISEDSVLDKWNLKRRATGDVELVVCIGDRLVEVNGQTASDEMSRAWQNDDQVMLRFVRGGAIQAGSLGKGVEEDDGESERKAKLAAELKQHFFDSAEACKGVLPAELHDIFGCEGWKTETNGRHRLEDCLRQFSVAEAIENDYKPTYLCSGCDNANGSKVFASRRMWLWPFSLPPILTLQIKRFRRYGAKLEKSSASVELPMKLDLHEFVLSRAQLASLKPHVCKGKSFCDLEELPSAEEELPLCYELYGICVHEGDSMRGGHYVAYVNSGQSLDSEQWFGISDSKVWSCNRTEVLKAEAYVCFYRREGTKSSLKSAEMATEPSGVERADGCAP